jgi:hypothetical protein
MCEWVKMNYLRCYGQTFEVNEDVADRNQDGLTGSKQAQGNWATQIGWRLPRIEVSGEAKAHRQL